MGATAYILIKGRHFRFVILVFICVYQSTTMKATRAVPMITTGVRHFGTTQSTRALPALLPQDGKKAMRARTWFVQGLTGQEDRSNGGIDVVIAPKDLAVMKPDLANWLKLSDAEKDDKLNAWRKAGFLKLNPDAAAKYWDINYPKYLHPGWVRFDSLFYGQGVAPGGITEEEIKHDPMTLGLWVQLLPIVILLGLAVFPNIKKIQ